MTPLIASQCRTGLELYTTTTERRRRKRIARGGGDGVWVVDFVPLLPSADAINSFGRYKARGGIGVVVLANIRDVQASDSLYLGRNKLV